MTLNLKINESTILTAYNDVIQNSNCDNWLLLEYEGNSNILKVGDQGDGGLEELVTNFNSGKLQYGVAAVKSSATRQPKIILIQWQGDGVPAARLAVTARHGNDLKRFLRGIHTVITARSEDDIDIGSIQKVVSKLAGVHDAKFAEDGSYVEPKPVGSVYQPIKPNRDIDLSERDSFWKKMEAEEADRLEEERRRANEKNATVSKEKEMLSQQLHEKLQVHNDTRRPANIFSGSSVPKKSNSSSSAGLIKGRKALFEQKASELAESQIKSPQKPLISDRSGFRVPPPSSPAYKPETRHPGNVMTPPALVSPPPPLPSSNPPSVPAPVTSLSPPMSTSSSVRNDFQPLSTPVSTMRGPLPVEIEKIAPEPEASAPAYYEEPPNVDIPPSDYGTGAGDLPTYYEEPPAEMLPPDVNGKTGGKGSRAVALWDYQAADDTEISFDPDDVITEIDQIDEGWWKGRAPDGRVGLFPANYVSLI